MKYIQSQLPKGYSFQAINKQANSQTLRSKRKDSTIKQQQNLQKKVKKEPAPPSQQLQQQLTHQQQFDSYSQGDTLNYDQLTQPQLSKRHSVRDKKQKVPFEHKYPELEQPIQPVQKFKSNNEILKRCYKVLQLCKRHKTAEPFLYPVDPKALNIPDYFNIIKEPMDLSTIEKNLKSNQYSNAKQFGDDMRKVFENSLIYNLKGSDIYFMTLELKQFFERHFKDIETKIQQTQTDSSHINELQKKVEKLSKEIKELNYLNIKGGGVANISKKAGSGVVSLGGDTGQKSKNLVSDKPMSQAEKRQLGQNIRKLPAECLRGVWEIVSSGNSNLQDNKEELEFDIDTLLPKKARELEKYVKQKLQQLNKQSAKNKKKQSKHQQQSQQQQNFTNMSNYGDLPLTAENLQQMPMTDQNQILMNIGEIPQMLSQQQSLQLDIQMNNNGDQMQNMQMGGGMSIPSPQQFKQINQKQQQQEDSKTSDSSFITDSEDEGNQNS